jgi:hypothetical protein
VGELVKADLDALRALAGRLATEAEGIDTIVTEVGAGIAGVVMPSAGLDDFLSRISEKLGTNITEHATNVRQLGQGAANAANTYEDVDAVFSGQLGALTGSIE